MKFINSISTVAGLMVSAAALAQVPFTGSISGASGINGSFTGSYTAAGGVYAFTLTGSTTTAYVSGVQAGSPVVVHPTLSTITSSSLAASGLQYTSFQNPGVITVIANGPQIWAQTRVQQFTASGVDAGGYPGATTVTMTFRDSANNVLGTGSFTIVPEPETYAAAAALGLVGFGLWRRRNA